MKRKRSVGVLSLLVILALTVPVYADGPALPDGTQIAQAPPPVVLRIDDDGSKTIVTVPIEKPENESGLL